MTQAQIVMMFLFLDLVLDTGELVTIEYQEKDMDDVYASIENCMKLKEWWCRGQFELCTVKFMGMSIERINMARVVAML